MSSLAEPGLKLTFLEYCLQLLSGAKTELFLLAHTFWVAL